MVLINGVKYACERCIRGHRVTTCSHTDQPLTMIKPKGRPASQCQHCRDQRKHKSLHVTCTCGQKGKSPSMHSTSCLCYKTSHCTCSSATNKKAEKTKKKVVRSPSDANVKGFVPSQGIDSGLGSSNYLNSGYVFEDVMGPLESSNGLFDLFSQSDKSDSNVNLHSAGEFQNSSSMSPSSSLTNGANNNNGSNGSNARNRSNSALIKEEDQEKMDPSDVMTTMFPLFPLVGNGSVEDNNSRPLSALPPQSTIGRNASQSSDKIPQSPGLASHSANAVEPRPVKPNFSQPYHYQQIRPKRPESVLSVTSNSSTATNVSKNHDVTSGYFPGPNSSAYPPSSGVPDWTKSDSAANFTLSEEEYDGGHDESYSLPSSDFKPLSLKENEISYDVNANKDGKSSGSDKSQISKSQIQSGLQQVPNGQDYFFDNSWGQGMPTDQEQFDMNTDLFNDLMPPIYETKSDIPF